MFKQVSGRDTLGLIIEPRDRDVWKNQVIMLEHPFQTIAKKDAPDFPKTRVPKKFPLRFNQHGQAFVAHGSWKRVQECIKAKPHLQELGLRVVAPAYNPPAQGIWSTAADVVDTLEDTSEGLIVVGKTLQPKVIEK